MSFARSAEPAVLETSMTTGRFGRYTILACDPVEEFVASASESQCAFHSFASRAASYPHVRCPGADIPFFGGWVGFFTYEAGLGIERIHRRPRVDADVPRAGFRLYDSAAVYDHFTDTWYVTAVDWQPPISRRRPSARSRLASLRAKLQKAACAATPPLCRPWTSSEPVPNMSIQAYLAKVARAARHIEAGDIYQVNLTQRWTGRTGATPLELYRRLRKTSPSSHAALLPWGNFAVISASPELFLELRDGHVVTRPIKGTRPRIGDPVVDEASRLELTTSDKERAELAMIVDLERNDLGKVCSYGTVRVTEVGSVEQHPTVFHRVATIEGDLQPGRDWLDLLLATCPGGSVTGAPKIRAMQIIDELEPTPRGVYCGSIGVIGLDGSMSFNVAIRTMLHTGNVVHIHAGGAIVADSVPGQEYDETLAKAAGMLRALQCPTTASYRGRDRVAML
ncbi:MAG: anthranilate synthase component I family protein [Phycisphaerae bacterium]